MANENMHMSSEGLSALARREGTMRRYYNDAANNCTYGVGTLVHGGPCTPEELKQPVSSMKAYHQFTMRVSMVENAVRRSIPNKQLTQAQFDALVSFVYNVGISGSKTALAAANRGAFWEVVQRINATVFIHPRDAHGHKYKPVRLPGLATRRKEEAAPFQALKANQ